MLRALLFVLMLSASCVSFAKEQSTEELSYHRDIKPIFRTKCYGCHQPARKRGELDMTQMAALLAGGESGDASIVPGEPEASYLVELITPGAKGSAEMPRDAEMLSDAEIARIKQWVAAGAKDDTPPADIAKIDAAHPPTYEQPPVLTSLEFSPDGTLLAVSGYHEVLLHKADGTELIARLVGLSERIESISFSPDGKWLAVTGGSPGRMGELQIWDVEKKTLKLSLPATFDTIYGASWSPDGKLVAFGCGDNTLRAIDVASGKQVLFQGAHADWVLDTVFSNDGKHLVSVSRDRSMKLTEVATQRFIDNITSITPGALKGGLHVVDRLPGKDELLIGGADGVPRLYRMFRTQARKIGDDFNLIRQFPALEGRIFSATFNADGSQLVAGSSSDGRGDVRVFQTSDAKQVAQLKEIDGGIYAVAFRPDSKVVASGGFAGRVFLNEAATGELLGKFVPVPLKE